MLVFVVFFFKMKTSYEMRMIDWSSDVCSADLRRPHFTAGWLYLSGRRATLDRRAVAAHAQGVHRDGEAAHRHQQRGQLGTHDLRGKWIQHAGRERDRDRKSVV